MPTRVRGELWMVVGALVMLVSALWTLTTYGSNRRAIQETRRAVRVLLNAGARFRLEYGYWPGVEQGQGADVRFGVSGRPNRRLIQVLRGRETTASDREQRNPRGIMFWEPPAWRPHHVGMNEFGELLDPWGTPFQIVVDGDLNGICEIARSVYGSVEAGMLVWSCGRDRRSDTADDICSWKR